MLTEQPDKVLSTSRAAFSTNHHTGTGIFSVSSLLPNSLCTFICIPPPLSNLIMCKFSVTTDNRPFTDYFVAFYYAGFIATLLSVAIMPTSKRTNQREIKANPSFFYSDTALYVFLQFHCRSHFQYQDNINWPLNKIL